MVEVGDAVDQTHDAPLQRGRHRRATGVAGDAVAHPLVEVEPRARPRAEARGRRLKALDHPQGVLVQQRADDVWKTAKLERLTLHDCRHTFASFAIAAGLNAKALSTYMGHSSVSITLDRYGHMMPGNEAEATTLLDAYLMAAQVS